METAVAYIRVSSQRQVDDGSSLITQEKQVVRYAHERGLNLVQIFREEGQSAKTDQRPRLQEMLSFCMDKRNGIATVIVPKIDRLARNVYDYTKLKLQLSRLGIRLESLGEQIDDTPVGRFTETILASVAQFDNEIRAERSKGGMVEAVEQGRWVWKPPLGYMTVRHHGKGTIAPKPGEAELVKDAFAALASGHHSVETVMEMLAKSGAGRSKSTLYRMIFNEVYIGKIHAFGRVHVAKPPFVPLVDEVTFLKAQAALRPSQTTTAYSLDSTDFPLRGTMLCQCGKAYTASWARGKTGTRYPYYRCVHCRGRSYARSSVHAAFSQELARYAPATGAMERIKQTLIREDELLTQMEADQRARLEQEIGELRKLRDAIVLKNASGVIPDDVAAEQVRKLSKQMSLLAHQIPTQPQGASVQELLAFATRFLRNLPDIWNTLTLKTKKDLLRFMFPEGILFDPERGFRNPASSLSEQVKHVLLGDDLHLVDPSPVNSKELRSWLLGLTAIAQESADYLSKQPASKKSK